MIHRSISYALEVPENDEGMAVAIDAIERLNPASDGTPGS